MIGKVHSDRKCRKSNDLSASQKYKCVLVLNPYKTAMFLKSLDGELHKPCIENEVLL